MRINVCTACMLVWATGLETSGETPACVTVHGSAAGC